MPANTPASRKAKGRKAQQQVRDAILAKFPELTVDDVRSTAMGQSGVDILLSTAAKKAFPFSVEVKAQENISIHACLKQAEENVEEDMSPLLIFKRNHSKMYVTLSLEDFMELL